MIKRLIELSVENRTLVILVMAVVSVLGIWAIYQTPVDAIPDLSDVQVIIQTEFPGQGPRIVEDQVTYPLASAMLSVPFATTVRGYSMFGTSFVYVIFEDGTDLYWARSRVLEYLNYVGDRLPDGVKPAIGPDATGVGWVFQYSLSDSTGTYDLSQLRSIQDYFVKYELQAVNGVSEVASIGGFVKQYQIVVDPDKLYAYGISLDYLKGQLRKSNQDVGGRLLQIAEREFIVRGRGYLQGIDDIGAIPLKTKQGTSIAIRDVATVRLGPEIRRGIAEKNGQGEVVGGIVVMRYGENALRVIEDVKTRLADLKAGLPEGVHIIEEYDRSALIIRAVDTLRVKLWEELAIVALIVLLFLLHARSAFVALISVPVGILISFLVMYLLGINANIMSLGGLAIAIGVMVDASLVLVENSHKHLERLYDGRDTVRESERRQAILAAAKEVGPSLFFSLLIVTISFLPVFTLEQVEGRLFRPLALTKTFAMAASSILAVTLVPALMVIFIRGKVRTETRNPLSRIFIWMYRPILQFSLKYPVFVILTGCLMLFVTLLPMQRMMFGKTLIPFGQLGSEFMPALNEGDLLYMPTTLPGLSPQKAKELLQQTDRIIASFPEVERVFGKIGRANTATDPAPLTMIETVIILKPQEEWRAGVSMDDLIAELDAAIQIPGLTNSWTMPIRTRIDMLATGIKTPVGVKLAGPDLATLEELGMSVEELLRNFQGTRSVYAERVMGGTFLDVRIRREDAARYGLTTGDIQSVLASAVGGQNVTTTIEGLERYPVNVRYPRDLRDSPRALESLRITTPSGNQVPLGQVADLEMVDGPPMIKSENARPNAWVFVDLESGVDVGSYVQSARSLLNSELLLPAGYTVRWSGQFEYMERANRRLQILIPLTLIIIFLLLFLHFRSVSEALLLLIPLPFAVIGAVWLLVFLGYNMSIAVGVGMIAVAGLAAETGIVMHVYLDEAINRFRAEKRLNNRFQLRDAIEEGAVDRLRPKLMTVFTTIIGLMPVMLGTGTGAEIMRRIATPMVGGLVTSTLHTLIMIPAIFIIVHGRRMKKKSTINMDNDTLIEETSSIET